MRRMWLGLFSLVLVAPSAGAQVTFAEAFAAHALRSTHIGGLTPLMSPAMIGRHLEGVQLALRYGLQSADAVQSHAVAASAIFSAGMRSSLALTAGTSDATCAGCSPDMMLGIGADMRVLERGDITSPGSSLVVAVSGDFGYAAVPGYDAVALGVGAPVSFSVPIGGRDGMRMVTFATPVFGIAQTPECPAGTVDCSRGGTRWVLGGGIGVWRHRCSD
jgi:hypothetical protein